MMTSFAAAIQDGIAYGSDITQRKDQQRSLSREAEGRAGIPFMSIFATLLSLDARGKITGDKAAGEGEEIKLVRRHTEASLFMRLRQTLMNDDRILQIESLDDLEQLRGSEKEYLVEISGQIFRSPLSEALETVFRVMDLFGMGVPTSQPSRAQGGGKKRRGQGRQGGAPAQDAFGLDAEEQQGLQLMTRIREDLAESKVQDVVLQPSGVDGLTVVVALAQEFLPEGAFDNVLSGDFSVLGKVTRIVEDDDEISLYQRTVFRNLESESLDQVFDNLRESGFFKLSEHPSHIKAPAIQIMPLAIYT
jgi:hypothetical protein